MARIDAPDVTAGGFETDLEKTEIEAWITLAHVIVDEDIDSSDYSDDRLDAIETNLTRHLIRSETDRQKTSEQIAAVQKSYAGNFDAEGLHGTSPGQMVLFLDTEGHLDAGTKPQADLEAF